MWGRAVRFSHGHNITVRLDEVSCGAGSDVTRVWCGLVPTGKTVKSHRRE